MTVVTEVVIMTSFRKKYLNTMTTEQLSGQLFATLAMFFYRIGSCFSSCQTPDLPVQQKKSGWLYYLGGCSVVCLSDCLQRLRMFKSVKHFQDFLKNFLGVSWVFLWIFLLLSRGFLGPLSGLFFGTFLGLSCENVVTFS